MKNFLQNLLIFFALCLCALLAYQWVRETDLRKDLQKDADVIHDKSEAVQNLTATVKRDETEIQRLDTLKKELTDTVKSNNLQIAALFKEQERATNELDRAKQQIEVYKEAIQKANENILKQNDDIKKQNEEMQKMAEERNDVVKKFNKMASDYNDLVNKWNQQQEELAKAATNAPAKK